MKNLKPLLLFLFLLSNFFYSIALATSSLPYYDEIRQTDGQIRPEYETAQKLWNLMNQEERNQFLKDSLAAFQGDNALDAMPRILTAHEYDNVLKVGVKQRADALRAFLQDHYSGQKNYAAQGIIPQAVVDRIIRRHHEQGFAGQINPDHISFIYGPDIIRDRHGNFRIIEDNPGWIGGMGDLVLAQDYILFRFPQLKEKADFRDAQEFYRKLADRYHQRAKAKGGVAVLYMIPPYPDNEDKRIRRHFADNGIMTVTPFSRMQLRTTRDGVYLYDSKDLTAKAQKVGMVALNGELYWLDPSHPTNKLKLFIQSSEQIISIVKETNANFNRLQDLFVKNPNDPGSLKQIGEKLPYVIRSYRNKSVFKKDLELIEKSLMETSLYTEELSSLLNVEAPDLDRIQELTRKLGFGHWLSKPVRLAKMGENLTRLFIKGKVDLNNSPGLDFIGDKEFYVYIEDLIRFYLKQKPLIRNIETEKFADKKGRLRAHKLEQIFSQLDQYVIKKVDGRGGDSVWVGPKIKPSEIDEIKAKITESPDEFIFQRYTPLSRLNDNIVDIRVITDVGPKDTFVTDTPWGRGLPKDGDGKVNISKDGREVTVLVHKNLMCRKFFEVGR